MFFPYAQLCVLITGGAGFIGSHIAEKLVNLGARVTIIDNLSSGNLENIAHIRDKITFVQEDVTNFAAMQELTKGKDVVFHLAALVSVVESMSNPQKCFDINIKGTQNVLEAARINDVKRVVFSSSAAVYGSDHAVCTEYSHCSPESPYGFSKYIGEQLCKQYALTTNLETVCLRYFNVYGDRQDAYSPYSAVVAKFKDLMRQNKPLTIFGDGLQTRDFVPVATIAQANLLLGCAPIKNGDVFNIATGKSITLLELIDELKGQFPAFDAGINFEPARPGDIKHSVAECSKYWDLYKQVSYAYEAPRGLEGSL